MSKKARSEPSDLDKSRLEMQAIMRAYAWLCENRQEFRTITFYINQYDTLKCKLTREDFATKVLKDKL